MLSFSTCNRTNSRSCFDFLQPTKYPTPETYVCDTATTQGQCATTNVHEIKTIEWIIAFGPALVVHFPDSLSGFLGRSLSLDLRANLCLCNRLRVDESAQYRVELFLICLGVLGHSSLNLEYLIAWV